MSPARPYRGIDADERLTQRRRRFVDAGLDLLGGTDDPADLTVRALCAHAGLAARYFYESFADKDVFVAAVFDGVVADIAATTQAAVAAAPRDEQNRAGIANLVRTTAGDARIGRLLFNPKLTNPVLARKRAELGGFFAALSGQHLTSAYRIPENAETTSLAHFVVGGVSQTIIAWLSGDVRLDETQLVEQLARILGTLADPSLVGTDAGKPRCR